MYTLNDRKIQCFENNQKVKPIEVLVEICKINQFSSIISLNDISMQYTQLILKNYH